MSANQSNDQNELRQALGAFTTGVTVVTTRSEDGGDVGLTANSFNSVSLDPPMVLWSLSKSSASLEAFKSSGYFAVHILAENQQDLSNRFAKRGIDKFSGLELERGPEEIPLLKSCAARFVCETTFQYEGGDHIIFVGEVVDFNHRGSAPLLFHSGQYRQLLKHGDMSQATDLHGTSHARLGEESLGHLFRVCYYQISKRVRQELESRDLSLAQYYLLAVSSKYEPKTEEELIAMLEPGSNIPTKREIDDLKSRTLIVELENRIHLTREGINLYVELLSIYKASEAEKEEVLYYDMRQTLRIALARLAENSNAVNQISDAAS